MIAKSCGDLTNSSKAISSSMEASQHASTSAGGFGMPSSKNDHRLYSKTGFTCEERIWYRLYIVPRPVSAHTTVCDSAHRRSGWKSMPPRLFLFPDRDVGHFGCPGTVSDTDTVPVAWFELVRKF
jgi:hypothetical protein